MKTTVTVDKVGRMVLPKPVREGIGISGPMSVNIEVVSGTAQISTPERQSCAVARRRGRTVYTGPLPSDWDSGEAVSRMRERRIQESGPLVLLAKIGALDLLSLAPHRFPISKR